MSGSIISNVSTNPSTLTSYLKAGVIAGIVSAVLNNIIYLIMITVGGYEWVFMIAVSILVASFLPNILASIALWGLSKITHLARPILTIGIVVFVLISVLPHLGIGPAPSPALAALPEGFDLVTVPLHLVFGLTAIVLIPWLVAKDTES